MSGAGTPDSGGSEIPGSTRLPILFVDVDGVVSLFGFDAPAAAAGDLHLIDGAPHCIARGAGQRLGRLAQFFELVWATGWETRANDHLPHLLGLPGRELPTLTFDGRAVFGSSHWKIEAINEYAADRPAAWIDDNLDASCERWAAERSASTLLVRADSAVGITDEHVALLERWARELSRPAALPL